MRAVIVAHLILLLVITGISVGSALGSFDAFSPFEAGLTALLGLVNVVCMWAASDTLRLLES